MLSDISIVVKSFLRPDCLHRFLKSVCAYEQHYQHKFHEIIVIDDSDEESHQKNTQTITALQQSHISYHHYSYNSIGLSKGRNTGVKKVQTPYFLLCDDDFMLDPESK